MHTCNYGSGEAVQSIYVKTSFSFVLLCLSGDFPASTLGIAATGPLPFSPFRDTFSTLSVTTAVLCQALLLVSVRIDGQRRGRAEKRRDAHRPILPLAERGCHALSPYCQPCSSQSQSASTSGSLEADGLASSSTTASPPAPAPPALTSCPLALTISLDDGLGNAGSLPRLAAFATLDTPPANFDFQSIIEARFALFGEVEEGAMGFVARRTVQSSIQRHSVMRLFESLASDSEGVTVVDVAGRRKVEGGETAA